MSSPSSNILASVHQGRQASTGPTPASPHSPGPLIVNPPSTNPISMSPLPSPVTVNATPSPPAATARSLAATSTGHASSMSTSNGSASNVSASNVSSNVSASNVSAMNSVTPWYKSRLRGPFSKPWQNCAAFIATALAAATMYYTVRTYSIASWTAIKDYHEYCDHFTVCDEPLAVSYADQIPRMEKLLLDVLSNSRQ
jgi:hypothetical protein